MNDSPCSDSLSATLQRRIDRLVDGECGWDETQSVLDQVERTPEGWRRLALTYLESQALGRELGVVRTASRLTGSPSVAAHPAQGGTPTQSHRRVPSWLVQALCLAAAVLVGFALGQSGLWNAGASSSPSIASSPASPDVQEHSTNASLPGTDSQSKSHGDVGHHAVVAELPSKTSPQGDALSGESLSMLVSDPQTSEVREVKLPLVRADSSDAATWQTASSPVPETVRAALERLGHEVHVERKLYPVTLGDGRTVVLPIDDVEVRSVQRQQYQ